ncbi:MAG TPA: glycosyltransferase family 39 protein [Anaerolineae bacterium]|nr:glycosyltransferase family 39 protein [Anaerolineae bacterium]
MTSFAPQHRNTADQRALVLLCLLAFGWRVAGLTSQSLWRDEVDSIRFASRPLVELLATFSRPGENGPLFFALLNPWLAALGTSEFALRLEAVLPGVLAVPLTYALARRLLRTAGMGELRYAAGLTLDNVPLLAALFVFVNPYLVWYSQEGKMYGWLVVLALATLLAFLAALGHGRWWRWLLFLVLLAVAALHHVWAILLVPICAIWLALLWPDYRRRWLPFLLTLAIPALPYFALLGWWQLRLFTTPDFQTGHPFVPLTTIATTLATAFSLGVARSPSPSAIAGLTFLLLTGSVLGGKAMNGHGSAHAWRRLRVSLLLLTWLLLPPLLLYLISLNKPLYTDRYVIWIGPALLLLVAQGVAALATIWRPLGRIALAALLAVGLLAGWRQMHTPIKSDFRAAAAYVEARRQPGDLLLFQMPYNRIVYEYYAGPQAATIDGRYTNSGSTEAQVDEEMRRDVGDAPAVWLIASEDEMWDQRRLVRQWLEAWGEETDQQGFARVEVLLYAIR